MFLPGDVLVKQRLSWIGAPAPHSSPTWRKWQTLLIIGVSDKHWGVPDRGPDYLVLTSDPLTTMRCAHVWLTNNYEAVNG